MNEQASNSEFNLDSSFLEAMRAIRDSLDPHFDDSTSKFRLVPKTSDIAPYSLTIDRKKIEFKEKNEGELLSIIIDFDTGAVLINNQPPVNSSPLQIKKR
ncbi:MAG: hypothetical protein ACI9BD_001580, partial [Candidatus Marinamargulisbacteria bacterium]